MEFHLEGILLNYWLAVLALIAVERYSCPQMYSDSLSAGQRIDSTLLE
jgi:hypothetical protein